MHGVGIRVDLSESAALQERLAAKTGAWPPLSESSDSVCPSHSTRYIRVIRLGISESSDSDRTTRKAWMCLSDSGRSSPPQTSHGPRNEALNRILPLGWLVRRPTAPAAPPLSESQPAPDHHLAADAAPQLPARDGEAVDRGPGPPQRPLRLQRRQAPHAHLPPGRPAGQKWSKWSKVVNNQSGQKWSTIKVVKSGQQSKWSNVVKAALRLTRRQRPAAGPP